MQRTDDGTYKCLFTMSDDDSPMATASVSVVTVTAATECVFVDLSAGTSQDITCNYEGASAATGVTFTMPDKTTAAGTLGTFASNVSIN